MLIVFPSDPAAEQAAALMQDLGITHQLISIPESLGYKTTADIALYIPNAQEPQQLMAKISAKGIVIMRVFKQFDIETH